MTDKPPCRLFAILAREAPIGVILRRGPSNWVRLIKWHTDTDTFEPGHWFHGRIYENCCDLSPDGSLFVYSALKITGRSPRTPEYTHVWTAISKTPWLTALALWFKGDACWGGGLFSDDKTVWINQDLQTAGPDKGGLPGSLVAAVKHEACNDREMQKMRLKRDGWHLRQEMQTHAIPHGYATDRPDIWCKRHPELNVDLIMASSMRKSRLVSEYILEDRETREQRQMMEAAWADWDQRGRLVFAGGGRLFAADLSASTDIVPMQIADFNDDEPVEIAPPEWASVW